MSNLYESISRHLDEKTPLVLATILTRNGSAPRTAGAQMIILPDGSIEGTIGGGLMEAQSIKLGMKVHQDRNAILKEFHMTGKDAASSDMICGGNQEVILEYLDPEDGQWPGMLHLLQTAIRERKRAWWITRLPGPAEPITRVPHAFITEAGNMECCGEFAVCLTMEPHPETGAPPNSGKESPVVEIQQHLIDLRTIREPEVYPIGEDRYAFAPVDVYGTVYIFGAGHVSQKLALLTHLVGFRTVVIDDRPEFANAGRFPQADEIMVADSFDEVFDRLVPDPNSYMVIVTRGHLHDKNVLARCLRIGAVYVGMIGSKRKCETVFQALLKEGYTRAELDRVYAPIGLPIEAESPEEIAVSITGELIQVRAKLMKAG